MPKGKFDKAWNLILRACAKCNGIKADLENDISVISMHGDSADIPSEDFMLMKEEIFRRAANTISRNTKRPVSVGEEPITLEGSFGRAKISFSLQMPPQASEKRLFDLACFQMLGFFYLMTYQDNHRRGNWWGGGFHPVIAVRRSDWGNPIMRWFEEITANSEELFHLKTASGFYKAWIRKVDDVPDIWAWALEWNHNFRLTGFCGNEESALEIARSAPTVESRTLHDDGNHVVRMRTHTALSPEQDHLFDIRIGRR